MYNLLRFLFQKQLYSIDLLFYYAAVLLFSCVFELFQVTVQICLLPCTVPTKIDFPRYNTKFSGENEILRGIVHVVSSFSSTFRVISWTFGLPFGQCG